MKGGGGRGINSRVIINGAPLAKHECFLGRKSERGKIEKKKETAGRYRVVRPGMGM